MFYWGAMSTFKNFLAGLCFSSLPVLSAGEIVCVCVMLACTSLLVQEKYHVYGVMPAFAACAVKYSKKIVKK